MDPNVILHHPERLVGVHPDLVRVVQRCAILSTMQFMVIEGLRTEAAEVEDEKAGASALSNPKRSRHLDGHAVDLGAMPDGHLIWEWSAYDKLAVFMKQAAEIEQVPIEWGGDWETFKDGTHFQLPWDQYPSA